MSLHKLEGLIGCKNQAASVVSIAADVTRVEDIPSLRIERFQVLKDRSVHCSLRASFRVKIHCRTDFFSFSNCHHALTTPALRSAKLRNVTARKSAIALHVEHQAAMGPNTVRTARNAPMCSRDARRECIGSNVESLSRLQDSFQVGFEFNASCGNLKRW